MVRELAWFRVAAELIKLGKGVHARTMAAARSHRKRRVRNDSILTLILRIDFLRLVQLMGDEQKISHFINRARRAPVNVMALAVGGIVKVTFERYTQFRSRGSRVA